MWKDDILYITLLVICSKICYFIYMNKTKTERFTDLVPAGMVWLTLFVLALLSLIRPLWAIYFIIIFVTYWIVRLFYMMVWLIISWIKYRRSYKRNWLADLKLLDKNYRDYWHIITLPTYKEPYEVVERTIKALLATDYDKDRMIVVLGGEAKDENNFKRIAEKIKNKYGNEFFKFIITIHKLEADELPGKGSNLNYMERQIKKLIDQMNINYENVIVSAFDIETLSSTNYFSCLTYNYLKQDKPHQSSYQPLILYNNNIWQSNPLIRVVASATTFWLLTDLSRPEKLLTFSSHSMSFKMLYDVGWHDKTIVTEDSRICLQGVVKYDGDYNVVPLFVTLSMDTVYIGKFWQSAINQYKQMRRWAWGVEHFPWMWKKFFGKEANKNIKLRKRLRLFWNQLEGMYSWATAPLIILIFGRLPLVLASDSAKATAFFQNAPKTLEIMMLVGMVGLILNSIMYTFMLPIKPEGHGWWNYIIMALQWVLFPLTMVIFGSIPAIEAQTRLLLGGKYRLGFWVTEKKV